MRQHTKNRSSEIWTNLCLCGLVLLAVIFGLKMLKTAPPVKQAPVVIAYEPTPLVTEDASIEKEATPVEQTIINEPIKSTPPEAVVTTESTVTPLVTSKPEAFSQEDILLLTDLDLQRKEVIQRDKKLFNLAIETKSWNAYNKLLEKSITAGFAKQKKGRGLNRFDAVWKEPALYQAFLRWQIIGKFSESVISAHVTDSYTGEFFTWLCFNPTAMEELLLTIKPEDDASKVLKFLMNAWPNLGGKIDKYFSLALACAVVYDKEQKVEHPIADEYGKKSVVEPSSRMRWFMENNEKGKLVAPVHRSNARDLVWVVCAPISTSELDWSLKKMQLSRKQWGTAYSMIEYLMERAVKGLNPYKEYSFSEILKEGGICGDQSYFCANTARAQGIPALILCGETDSGGHAWVGLKSDSDEWTTGIGRIGGVSKGETTNPQTGQTVTEQEVQSWNDRAHHSSLATLAVARLLWMASYFEETDKIEDYMVAVTLANKIGPSFTETWAALYHLLREQTKLTGEPARPSNINDWKEFVQAMRRQFKENPRMAKLAVDAEAEFIFPYDEEGDSSRTLLRERRRIERNSGEQKDLIAESLKREAEIISKRGDGSAKQDIGRLYDSALRKYGGSITGFKMMAEDYFGYLKDDPELARKAARDIELAFKRVIETGTKDFFRAETEASICKMICSYYRAAGDQGRAEKLEKRYEIMLGRAKRGAL